MKDDNAINAFALSGGQIFITYALFFKLRNEDKLAGLGKETGHVVGRYSVAQLAKQGLIEGILNAFVGIYPNTAQERQQSPI